MTLWTPGQVELTHKCRICGLDLHRQGYASHIKKCVEAHRQELHDESPVRKVPEIYDDELGDPEYRAFVRNLPKEWLNPDNTWRETSPNRKRGRKNG